MNLLSHFDEMRSSEPNTLKGHVKKFAGQAAFYVLGAGAAIVVLVIVLIMHIAGRSNSR